ncbi:uncharacterized protein [Nicotiana sylvestris]|uniref:uncharacterized protein n=1 Tax=Nicotiana sylvestris TaxID=4096 RepID=UPI00388C7BE9
MVELLKDYDITILYHPGKANVVADALSRKMESLGSLAYLLAAKRPLAWDVQVLSNQFVRLDVLEPSRVLACVVSRSFIYDFIREHRCKDDYVYPIWMGYVSLFFRRRYCIHPGAAKMYQDFMQHYWWRRMKKDIVEYVVQCLNFQQVKYEHQRPRGLPQRLEIPELK